ncbi:tetratricopeptide repeat protein [Hyphobacterium sp. HN65]|uniref:Tetratricopeptide repeat protein n=1 Tax=Hyphobacterium lacteum TaxID=3116575 RepID=A0ABU7LPW8_9PROT|nr:tetratricopeptide repeat protein [Hyphobacterium sp. HN65]MEE2525389.1 tetratricopeptide repeat protein [Hyphobacterium sp. HN65]
MRRFTIFLPVFLAGTASAAADLVDVRELGNGHEPDIFIGFDVGPEILASRVDGRVIELDVMAAIDHPRRIEPARSRWISSIETLAIEGHQTIRLELVEGADAVEVVRTETGLRLSWAPVAAEGDWPAMPENPVVEDDMPAMASGDTVVPAEAEIADSADADTPVLTQSGAAAHEDAVQESGASADECVTAAAALEVDSWDIDALTVSASCRIAAGDTDDAIVMLERVIAFEPGRFEAVIALAEANEAVGNVENARLLYEQAAMVAATDGQAVAARARARQLTN